MRTEVCNAVDFISRILKSSRARRCLSPAEIERFRQTLLVLLCTHYQDHWFPEKPVKGSGYRCIRINNKMDPLVSQAGQQCGFSEADLFDIMPAELTLWVDPDEVSYRIGEEGSIAVLYDASDSEETSSSDSTSSGSPSPCPQDSFNRSSTTSSPVTPAYNNNMCSYYMSPSPMDYQSYNHSTFVAS